MHNKFQVHDLDFNEFINTIKPTLFNMISLYGWNEGKGKNRRAEGYINYNDVDNTPIAYPANENDIDKIAVILLYSDYLPEYTGSSSLDVKSKHIKEILKRMNQMLLKFKEYQNYKTMLEQQKQAQKGKGVDCSGGKFLNRFKDYEPDINKLKSVDSDIKEELKNIKNELKELKDMLKESKPPEPPKPLKAPEPKPEPKQEKTNDFLSDILNRPSLKHVEEKTEPKPEPEEYSDIKDILRKRREDIEPDEYSEDEEDWGEGIKLNKNKVMKFSELIKLLK